MGRCVVIGGAVIGNYERIRKYLQDGDYYIYCDGGLAHRNGLGVPPDLIVGDFDSHENPRSSVETIVLPREKDDTDTMYAVKEGLRRGYEDFLLIGAAGGRMDHTLSNIYILLMLADCGKKALLADDYSEMEIVMDRWVSIPDSFPWFSLLNISGTARDITIEGAKYPLRQAAIDCVYQYGISNEALPGQTARVRVGEGCLLLIRVTADQTTRPAGFPDNDK